MMEENLLLIAINLLYNNYTLKEKGMFGVSMKKKILLGLRESTSSNSYTNRLRECVDSSCTIVIKHLSLSINRALDEDTWDFLILQDDFDERSPLSMHEMHRYREEYPELRIILLLNDERKKSEFMQQLLNVPIYDSLFFSDATATKTVEIINNPRTKKDARLYYDINNEHGNVNEILISDLIKALEKVDKEEIEDTYEYCLKKLKAEHREIFHDNLPLGIIEHLRGKENPNIEVYFKSKDSNEAVTKDKKKLISKFGIRNAKGDSNTTSSDSGRVVEKTRTSIIKHQKTVTVADIPSDYKKLVVITGIDNSGISSISASILYELSSRKIAVCGIDLSKNLDMSMYHKLPEDERSTRDLLLEVESFPYIINNFLAIYGGCFSNQSYAGLTDTVYRNLFDKNLVVVIEANYRTSEDYKELLSKADQVLVVHSADPKYCKADYRVSEIIEASGEEKTTVILNFSSGHGRKKNQLRVCLKKEFGCEIRGLITVPFSQEFMDEQWRNLTNRGFVHKDFKNYSKRISEIGRMIYPQGRQK